MRSRTVREQVLEHHIYSYSIAMQLGAMPLVVTSSTLQDAASGG